MFRLATQSLFVRNLGAVNFIPKARLAHGEPYDDENLTGIKRMFNAETIRGRANYAKLYLCMWTGIFIAWKIMKGKKTKTEPRPIEGRRE